MLHLVRAARSGVVQTEILAVAAVFAAVAAVVAAVAGQHSWGSGGRPFRQLV